MQGNKTVIEHLNKNIAGERKAINQYELNAAYCRYLGWTKAAAYFEDTRKDEEEHVRELLDRLHFLEGTPAGMSVPVEARTCETVEDMMRHNLVLETEAVNDYSEAIEACEAAGDHGTGDLFLHILKEEEEHLQEIDRALELAKRVGAENFLLEQL